VSFLDRLRRRTEAPASPPDEEVLAPDEVVARLRHSGGTVIGLSEEP